MYLSNTLKRANLQLSIVYNTIESNVRGLYDFLYKNISRNIDEQEKYLRDYPLKIKFINNFYALN